MLYLSELLLREHQLDNFNDLVNSIVIEAKNGQMFFSADVRPPFTDTPEDWEVILENAFTSA